MDRYVDKETLEYPLSAIDIMSRNPLTGFPEPFVPLPRYAFVPESVVPAFDAETHKPVHGCKQIGEDFVQTWTLLALTPEELEQRAAEREAADKAARDAARVTITRTQGLIFLYRALGIKESDIDSMIADPENGSDSYEAGLYFRAANWESDNPFVLLLGQRVGLDTPEKLESAFRAAQTL